MTILVTGATGLVGNNMVRMLLERGDAVRVVVRESSDPRPLEGLDVDIQRGDIRDNRIDRQGNDRYQSRHPCRRASALGVDRIGVTTRDQCRRHPARCCRCT